MIIPLGNAIAGSMIDRDASEFIRVAQITDGTQIRAINELCKDLKREGLWSSFNRAYPFVYNGTTASMLVCLKTRESLLIGTSSTPTSITFSNTGVQFGLTSSLIQSGVFSYNPVIGTDLTRGGHISIYSRTSNNPTNNQSHSSQQNSGQILGIEFTNSTNPSERKVRASFFGTTFSGNPASNNVNNAVMHEFTFTSTDNSGFYVYSNQNQVGSSASVTNPWIFYMSRNDQVIGTASSLRNWNGLGVNARLGFKFSPYDSITGQSLQEICWWSFGGGTNFEYGSSIDLSKQQVFYQIIQKFQTRLNRQV